MRRGTLYATVFSFLFSSTLFPVSVSAEIDQQPLNLPPNLKTSGVTWEPNDAADKAFDYVVVGGGLTGIAVAARLAENPSTTVLVIEAGRDDRWDERVKSVYQYKRIFEPNCDLVWIYNTDHGRNITA